MYFHTINVFNEIMKYVTNHKRSFYVKTVSNIVLLTNEWKNVLYINFFSH